MNLYRDLDPREAQAFRAWAREHYTPFSPIEGVWHPVVQAECVKINEEQGYGSEDVAGLQGQGV